jgi:hypothetical protein
LDWVSACDAALAGHEIIMRAYRDGVFSGNYPSVKIYNDFAAALGNIGQSETRSTIERAKKAFLALQKPSLRDGLNQEDVDAAQRLVAGFDHLYKPKKIDVR